uniref:Uncharacterized protein n=1 Tax=Romanomermis culicivorax TaxID=13658 RepID=A0A915HVN1_ROMCU
MILSTLLSTVLLVFTVKAGDERCDRDEALKRIETSLAIDSMTATKVHVDDIRRGQQAYSRMKDSLAKVSATGLLHDVSHDQAMKRVEQLAEQQLITVEQKDAFAFNRPSIVLGTAAPMLYSSVVMTRIPGAPDRVTLAYTILKLQPSNSKIGKTAPSM